MYTWKNMERKFGHCVVNWKIENYYVLPMDNEWQICSPEFNVRGFKATTWNMMLLNTQVGEEFSLRFVLQKLQPEGEMPHFIGKCSFNICNAFERSPIHNDDFIFTNKSYYERQINVIRNTTTNSVDWRDLCISCKLFIRFKVEEQIEECSDIGLRSLSEDLLELFENERDIDVIFEVKDANQIYNISGHKPILHSRNKKLKEIFDSNENVTKFTIDHFGQYDEWRNIIRFLYTANMKHVLDSPTENYYNISLPYYIEPIVSFYQPDELSMYSAIPVEEFSIKWTIPNFLAIKEICLRSSQFKIQNAYCDIMLYPKSFYREDETCISIEVKITEGIGIEEVPKIVLVEIFAINADDKNCLGVRYGKVSQNRDLKKYAFQRREVLKDYLQNRNLTLLFKLQMTNYNHFIEYKRYFGKSIVECKPYSNQNNYLTLSEDLSKLYNDRSIHKEINILIAGEQCFIHRCILSARAQFLYEKIQQSRIVNYPKVKRCIINDLIYFMYSGKYDSLLHLDDIICLYNIADSFNINSLSNFLLYILQLNIETFSFDELKKVFEFGDSKNIPSLIYSAHKRLARSN